MDSATLSPCSTYRYTLTRDIGGTESPALFVMLNPSTADASVNDPTVRRCMGFAARWRASELVVVNLFAYRSPVPKALRKAADPVGNPENDEAIREALKRAGTVVCAWGNHGGLKQRDQEVLQLIRESGRTPMCLRITKAGQPEHPLFVPANTPLMEVPHA